MLRIAGVKRLRISTACWYKYRVKMELQSLTENMESQKVYSNEVSQLDTEKEKKHWWKKWWKTRTPGTEICTIKVYGLIPIPDIEDREKCCFSGSPNAHYIAVSGII